MLRTLLTLSFMIAEIGTARTQSGTPEDQRACSASVKQFCSSVVQDGDMAILACLQQNRARIEPACQRVLIKYGQ